MTDNHTHGPTCAHCSHEKNHTNKFRIPLDILVVLIILIIDIIFSFPTQISLAILLTSYIVLARNIILNAAKGIFSKHFLDENFLMTIASIVAFLIGDYHEGIAVILFYRVGSLFEDRAIAKSENEISKLFDVIPQIAHRLSGGNLSHIKPSEIEINDILLVKPGEKVPVDGYLHNTDEAILDMKAITGESIPVNVEKELVLSGSINLGNAIYLKAVKTYDSSTIAKIVALTNDAKKNKAPYEKFITKFAKIYTPFIVIIAILVAFVPWLIFGASLSTWIYKAATFLVVSCPCALVISVPLAYFAAIGKGSRMGILLKGGSYLDTIRNMKHVIFDKTGTLTKGKFSINKINLFSNDYDEKTLLSLIAALESYSNHPIASSFSKHINSNYPPSIFSSVKEVTGSGIIANYQGNEFIIGNAKFLSGNGIDIEESNTDSLKIHAAYKEKYLGYISLKDTIREDANVTINFLKRNNIEVSMLTGDRELIAKDIASELNIDNYHHTLLPEDKVTITKEIIAKDKHVIFIGDGINDAPALALSKVGISMGNIGQDIAVESSNIVLMSDKLKSLVELFKLSKRTHIIVLENIIVALFIKFAVLILAILGLGNMWLAVFADVGVAILAILNSIRLLVYKNR